MAVVLQEDSSRSVTFPLIFSKDTIMAKYAYCITVLYNSLETIISVK